MHLVKKMGIADKMIYANKQTRTINLSATIEQLQCVQSLKVNINYSLKQ